MRDPKLVVDTKGSLNILLQAVKYEDGKAKQRKSLIVCLNGFLNISSQFKSLSFGSAITNNWLWDMKWIKKKAYFSICGPCEWEEYHGWIMQP